MIHLRLFLSLTVPLVALCLVTTPVLVEAGGPAGGTPTCFIPKPNAKKNAVKLNGTVAAVITTGVVGAGLQDVDVAIRVSVRNGPISFFRIHLVDFWAGISNEQRVCRVFDVDVHAGGSANDDAVEALVTEIRVAFDLAPSAKIFLVGTVDKDGNLDFSRTVFDDEPEDADQVIPGTTTHAGTLGNFQVVAQTP